ncbi:MAG: hypothetical protein AVDCRST_MAG93-7999, partial [uncultured Chloroflexia bacterium]
MSPLPRWSSDVVPVVAIVGASILLPMGGVAFSVATGVAGALATPLTKNGSDWCLQRLISGQELLNHDLQAALLRAFDQSMRHLEKLWETSHQRDARHSRMVGESSPSDIKALFRAMRQDIKAILTETRLTPVIGSAEAMQLLHRQDIGTQASFNSYLAPYLDGHSQQFVTFLKRSFAPQLACRFGEELKADTKAWRAFQRLVNDSLLDAARAMRDSQHATNTALAKIEGHLKALDERFAARPDTERDLTGEAGLDTKIAKARDEVIAALVEQFEVAQDQIRAWFEETWALVVAEIGQLRTENHDLHAQTQTAINELRIDIEKLGLTLQARDEAHSRHVFEVPHLPNPHLVARDDLLDSLERELMPQNSLPRIAALWGLGGVGKTQVAAAYAFRHAENMHVVWWLQAQSDATITSDYVVLARALQLPGADAQDQTQVAAAAIRWLERSGQSWLLIFDNAERQDAIRPFLPRMGNGQVIVTSTSPAWGALTLLRYNVKPLELHEAADFLEKRLGTSDRASADQLANALGGLPLALAQAAAYMETTGTSIAGYLDLFTEHRLRVLDASGAPADHHLTVTATWRVALERVREETPAAIDLLSLCAFLAPERIPLGLLATHREALVPQLQEALRDGLAITMTVGALHAYSLVEVVSDNAINVHILVQNVVRDWVGKDQQRMWSQSALEALDANLPIDFRQPLAWETYARLAEHAHVCVDHMSRLVGESADIARLLSKTGSYFQERALYSQARADVERELKIMEAIEEFTNMEIAAALDRYAGVLRSQGELSEAKNVLDRAFSLVEASTRRETMLAASIQNSLGNVLRAQR